MHLKYYYFPRLSGLPYERGQKNMTRKNLDIMTMASYHKMPVK